jgi:hypothetical protein
MLAATAAQHQFVPWLSVDCILKFVSLLGIFLSRYLTIRFPASR